MYLKNVSGQYIGFPLVSAISGYGVTGLATGVSGYVVLDGGTQTGLAGTIAEAGFGQYFAKLFAADTNGNDISYYFIASGCVPIEKTVITVQAVSGFLYPASGIEVVVPTATLSGVVANSGLFVTVPIASISGAVGNSGQFVSVPSATLSGVVANSGLFVTVPISSISGVFNASGIWPASGAFVVASFVSGQVFLASGTQVLVYSGQLSGQPIAGLSGFIYHASGTNATVPPSSLSGVVANSGLFVTVPTATLSGVVANSGLFVTVPIATISGAVANSGLFVTVPIATISGTWPASGAFTVTSITSGQVFLASGTQVLVYSGQLSGQPIAGLSGFIYPASGVNATVPIASLSGVQPISGTFVSVPISSISGVSTASGIWPASGAFTVTTIASGTTYLASGTQVLVYSGQLSGQPIAGLSGFIYTASGIWPASGANVVVPISTISGVSTASGIWPASGAFTVTTIASGTTYLASGTQVLVYSGQLSGQPIAGLSGFIYPASGVNVTVPPASISGVFPASGITASIASGRVWLASGSISSGSSITADAATMIAEGGDLSDGFAVAPFVIWAIKLASAASSIDDTYNGNIVSIIAGTGAGQSREIVDYIGSTRLAIIGTVWTTLPDATSQYRVVPFADTIATDTGTVLSGTTTTAQLNSTGAATDDNAYIGQTVVILSQSGAGESRTIIGYSGGNSRILSVYPPWVTTPSSGSMYKIIPLGYAYANVMGSGIFNITTFSSGVVGGGSGNLPSAWGGSGAVTVGQNLDKSGYNLTSGGSFIASGSNVVVPPSTLSGVFNASGIWPASGAFTVTTIASGTTYLASGTQVLVYSGQLSGQPIAGLSGFIYTASGIWPASGAFVNATATVNSGLFVTVPISSISGVNVLASQASGTTFLASGQAVYLYSGQTVGIYSGQLSGQPIAGLSGFIYTASGIWPASGAFVNATATVNSGLFVTVPISSISGVNVLASQASGTTFLASGQSVYLYSGQTVGIYSGQLSGQPIAGLSGFIYPASGIWPASGAFTVTTIASGTTYLASGTQVLVYSGQLSGQPIAGLSGFIYHASGINAVVPPSSISGVFTASGIWPASGAFTVTTIASGTTYLASGTQVLVYSGQLSGQPIAGLSGFVYTASGIWPASGAFTVTTIASGTTYLASGQLVGLLSGQFVNVYSGQLSGQPIAGLSGQIYTASGVWPASGANVVATATLVSGQVFLASGTQVLVYSGQLSGQPIAGLSGFIYTASGIWPASGAFVNATATVNSGLFVTVPISSISGVNVVATAASGLFVTVPISSISGVNVLASQASGTTFLASGQAVYLYSGQTVGIYSGQLSGQPIAGLSGFIYTASGIWPASGAFTVTTIASGTTYLASGTQVLVYSGQLSGQPIAGLSGFVYPASGVNVTVPIASISGVSVVATANSGLFVTVPINTISGTTVVVPPSTLSGVVANSGLFVSVPIATISGVNVTATANSGLFVTVPISTISGVNVVATAASGLFVTVPISTISGVNVVASQASGTTFLASGQSVYLYSGQFVNVYSGQLSGQPIAGLSGFIYTASGIWPASGAFVTGTLNVSSGTLYLASGSIFITTFASGVVGGGSGNLPSAWGGSGAVTVGQNLDKSGYSISFNFDKSGYTDIPISGQTYIASGAYVNATATISSGQVYLASGTQVITATNLDKSGYSLLPTGVDTIPIETGINMRQALAIIGASAAGKLSGAGTAEVLLQAMANPGTNRIDATVDLSGNRLIVNLTPPP